MRMVSTVVGWEGTVINQSIDYRLQLAIGSSGREEKNEHLAD